MISRLVRFLAAFCMLATLARSADTVELLPGKITGTVHLSSETIANGYVSASATDGSGSASSSFTGETYSIIVPAGKTWKLSFNLSPQNANNTYSSISINTAEQISVGASQTVTQNYAITSTRITADVQVLNGTLSSIGYLQAYGNNGAGADIVYFSSYAQGSATVPALPFTGVSAYGTANVQSAAGLPSTVALPSTTLDVGATGANVKWTVDASFTGGTIQGALALSGSPSPSSAYVYFYGPDGAFAGTSLTGNSAFLFENLKAGNYSGYLNANFPDANLSLYRAATVTAGNVTTVNFAADLAGARVDFHATGFLDAASLSGASIYGYGPDNSSAGANLGSSGAFAPVVTAGAWNFPYQSFYIYNNTVYVSLSIYDYVKAQTTTAFNAGDNLTLPAIDLNTTQTELTFDVIEPAGAATETLISYPRLQAYTTTYNATGNPQLSVNLYAQSNLTNQAKPRVKLVGPPGSYTVYAYGNVEGSDVSFGTFTLELKAPLPTPVGTHVAVNPGAGTTLVFDQVTAPGVTTASQLPVGPALPGGYTGLTSSGQKVFYSVSTTATFTGFVDVTVTYDAASVPAALTGDLHLFYFDDASQQWIDITTGIDAANNQVSGTAPALSLFALGLPHSPTLSAVVVPADALKNTALNFSASFTDSDPREQHTAVWTWGDGSATTAGTVSESAGSITGAHTYAAAGTYHGQLTLTDITGRTVTQIFEVVVGRGVVADTTAPVITVAASFTAEAVGPNGAAVNFAATASDDTDGSVAVSFSRASGSVFPVGTTTVTATAHDAAGNVATKTFTVTVLDTVKPVLSLPANLTLEATSASGASATFSASATDNVDGSVAVTLSAASGSTFALGTTTVTATATDRSGNVATGSFTVTVRDTVAPVVTAPANVTAEATSAAGATVNFAASVFDVSGATLSYSKTPGSVFPLGTTTVTVTATDAAGNTSVAKTFTVTVRDTTKPVFTALSTNAPTLWPPNHKMVAVTVTASATDAVGPVTYRILTVTSSEPDNGLGDGDTANDIQITGAMTVNLRAERSGKGNGRTYTITVEAKDAAGNVTTKTVAVSVPKDQSGK